MVFREATLVVNSPPQNKIKDLCGIQYSGHFHRHGSSCVQDNVLFLYQADS